MRSLTFRSLGAFCVAGVAVLAAAAPAMAAPASPAAPSAPKTGSGVLYQQPHYTVTYNDNTCGNGTVTLTGLDPRVTWAQVLTAVAGMTGPSSNVGIGNAGPISGGAVTIPFTSAGTGATTPADTLVIVAGLDANAKTQPATMIAVPTSCSMAAGSGKMLPPTATVTTNCADGTVTATVTNTTQVPITINARITDTHDTVDISTSRSASDLQPGKQATFTFPNQAMGEHVFAYTSTGTTAKGELAYVNSVSFDVTACTASTPAPAPAPASAPAPAPASAPTQPAQTAAAPAAPGLANTGGTN